MSFPKMALSVSPKRSLIVLALLGALAGGLSAKPRSSLTDLEIEAAEAKVNFEKVLEENHELQEKLAVAEAQSAKMTESLANSQMESEVFRRQTAELKLKLEALGADAIGGNSAKLQERLLQLVNNLRLSEEKQKQLTESLSGLTESLMHYLKTGGKEAGSRLALEGQMRRANELLGASPPGAVEAAAVSATLTDGMVISIKDELSLVVANVGQKQGVKVGMPFQVIRGDQLIGTVRVVDARDKIAGAVIQNLTSEKERIKVGDRLKVEASQ
jgi:hypothetical protein